MSIVYQTLTVSEIRNWLELGKNDSILDHAISRTRANALAHCPYVKDDDVLVVTAMDGEKVVNFRDKSISYEQSNYAPMMVAESTATYGVKK